MELKINLIGRWINYFLKQGVYWLLIKQGHVLNVIAIVLVLLAATILLINILWLEPPDLDKVGASTPGLSAERIEGLGKWIEERVLERGRVIELREDIWP